MREKKEKNELNKYLLNKIINNIDILTISETKLHQANEFKKSFKTTVLIEIKILAQN